MRIISVFIILLFFTHTLVYGQVLDNQLPSNFPSAMKHDAFGYDVAMDGKFAVVGAPQFLNGNGNGPGRVYIYEFIDSLDTWVDIDTLSPQPTANNSYVQFGISVAISGNVIVVGAFDDQLDGSPIERHGIVYVYERDTLTQDWVFETMLTAKNAQGDDVLETGADFGSSVDTDGTSIIVGEPLRDFSTNFPNVSYTAINTGAVYIYSKRNGVWDIENRFFLGDTQTESVLGNKVAIDGDYAIAGAFLADVNTANDNQGVVEVYKKTINGWIKDTSLTYPIADPNFHFFGRYLALDGNRMAISGELTDNSNPQASNPIYIYELEHEDWIQKTVVEPISGSDGLRLSLALKDDLLMVGAYFASGFSGLGEVFIYQYDTLFSTNDWRRISNFRSTASFERFGWSVDLVDECKFFIGSPYDNDYVNNYGRIAYKEASPLNINSIQIVDPDSESLATFSGNFQYCCSNYGVLVVENDSAIIEEAKARLYSQPEKFYQIPLGDSFSFETISLEVGDAQTITNDSGAGFFTFDTETGKWVTIDINTNKDENHGVIFEAEIRIFDDGQQLQENWVVLIPLIITGYDVEVRGRTTLPQMPYMIVHDPPGGNSYSEFTSGRTFCRKFGTSFALSGSVNTWGSVKLGGKAGVDFGFGKVENSFTTTTTVDVETGFQFNDETENEQCFTTTETIRTSNLTGGTDSASLNDVYIGYGTDLIYGVYKEVSFDNKDCLPVYTNTLIARPDSSTITDFAFTESGILSDIDRLTVLINDPTTSDSLKVIFQNQIDVWNAVIETNKNTVSQVFEDNDSEIDTIIAINGSLSRTVENAITVSQSSTFEYNFYVSIEVATEVSAKTEVEAGGSGGSVETAAGVAVKGRSDFGGSTSTNIEETKIFKYELSDDQVGDFFYISVKKDPVYGTQIFQLQPGSKTSCPYEGGLKRDNPRLEVQNNDSNFVSEAVFRNATGNSKSIPLNICNYSESLEFRDYDINVEGGTNPNNAILKVDGKDLKLTSNEPDYPNLESNTCFLVNGNNPSLLVQKSDPNIDIYENIRVFMHPSGNCDPNNRSTVNVSVYFGDSYNECSATNLNLTTPFTGQAVRRVSNNLTAANVIHPASTVIFSAQNILRLLPGFHAQKGSQFQAKIEACNVNTFSEETQVLLGSENEAKEHFISIQPNPFSQQATVKFYIEKNADQVELAIRDINGRIVKQMSTRNFVSGWNEWIVQADGLKTGMYFISLHTTENSLIEKFLVTKR